MFESLDRFTGGHWRTWTESPDCDLTIHHQQWVDGQDVADTAAALAEEFKVHWVGVDSYRSRELQRLLGEEGYGLPIQPLNQSGKALQAGSVSGFRPLCRRGPSGAQRRPGGTLGGQSNAQVKYDAMLFPKVVKPDPNETRTKIDPVMALVLCRRQVAVLGAGTGARTSGVVAGEYASLISGEGNLPPRPGEAWIGG